MAITAAQVKELREMTGAGMMECKKALTEADADMDKAVDLLREWGVAKVAKKAGRATNEGTIMAVVADDAKSAAVIELNCETDFVGMNEKFKGYAEQIAKIELAKKYADAEALKADEEVAALITDCVHVMGENTQLARAIAVEGDGVCAYIHMGGKIGVVVKFDVDGTEVALTPDDCLISPAQKEGFVAESDGGMTVVIDTNLTPALIEKGYVREVISKLQTMRKDLGFEVTDRISVRVACGEKLAGALKAYEDMIKVICHIK